MDKAQKGSKNMHGVAAKKEIIYEINRELRKKEIQKKGLTSNPLANMVLCEDLIIKQDMELRQGIDGDTDLSCLGVVRKNDWCNGVKVYLWNRISLDILMQFSLNGRLVLHIDSTKYGSFGLHNSTNDSKKVLFTPLSTYSQEMVLSSKTIRIYSIVSISRGLFWLRWYQIKTRLMMWLHF